MQGKVRQATDKTKARQKQSTAIRDRRQTQAGPNKVKTAPVQRLVLAAHPDARAQPYEIKHEPEAGRGRFGRSPFLSFSLAAGASKAVGS